MPSELSSRIHFFLKRPIRLNRRKALKTFIENAFSKKKLTLQQLNIIFCSDRELLNINRKYLDHDYYTDIITFDYEGDRGVEAEIFISVERVRENAREREIPVDLELHRVIFHGVLHLCGINDKSPKERKVMSRLEDKLLSAYFKSAALS